MTDTPPAHAGRVQPAAAGTFKRIHKSVTSAYPEPAELALKSDDSWRATWAALWPNEPSGSPPPRPAVDFTHDLVVLVATGPRSSGGFDVRVDSVSRDAAGTVTVRYTVTSPGPGCFTTQQITSPVDVVRVPQPRLGAAVRFVARRVATPC